MNDIDRPKWGGGGGTPPQLPSCGARWAHCPPPPGCCIHANGVPLPKQLPSSLLYNFLSHDKEQQIDWGVLNPTVSNSVSVNLPKPTLDLPDWVTPKDLTFYHTYTYLSLP